MVIDMTKYGFILLSGDAEGFLKKLQGVGMVDITRASKPIDEPSEKLSNRANNIRKALTALKTVEPSGSTHDIDNDIAEEVNLAVADKERLQAKLSVLQKTLEERKPWGRFDPDRFATLAEQGLQLHFYKAKTSAILPEWKEQYAFSEISTENGYTYFVITSDSSEYHFPLPEMAAPDRDFTAIEQEISQVNTDIEQLGRRLAELKCHEAALQKELDKTLSDLDLHLAGIAGTKAADNYLTVFEGFAPKESEKQLHEMLDKENVFYIAHQAQTEDNPPIKLKNNKFVSMFEVLTDMYGRPKYDEFDPTVWISIFFMLFFGFCMGDMGYGLILMLLGFGLKKMMPKLAPLVVTLGVATTAIGFFFHTFFSMDLLTWNIIPEGVKKIMLPSQIAGFDGTMVLAIIIGIIHLCLAMIVKTYQATKTKGFANSLGTWGWTLLIVGGVIVGGLALMKVIDSSITKWIIIVLGILSALGIFFLNNLHRNPLLNVGAGLWDTYNTATGLLGDVLSYLRLYALGLAGAKLGEAFNAIGQQALGDGGFGWVFFILIVTVGHSLNLAMCVLGAFVHPLRLNFLEFFKNSGYEGTGRKYNPLTENANK